MTNFLKNLINLFKFKKNEKKFKRIIFNENRNTLKYLDPLILISKKKTCIISLEKIDKKNSDQIEYFFFSNNIIISILFSILKIKFLYTTTPDLNSTVFKRSIFNKTKYIYIQHSPVSLSMAYRDNAFIHFDAIHAVNRNQYSDIMDLNRLYKKKIKPLRYRYFFLDQFTPKKNTTITKIDYLIAPTWNTNFYKLNLHKKIFNILKDANKTFVFRPHYMSINKKEFEFNDINLKTNEIDISSEFSFDNYSNLISDWSGIYLEFAILKKIKPILINSKMKVRNNEFEKFTMQPIELELRNSISFQFDEGDLDNFIKYISKDTNLDLEQKEITNILISKFY